MMSWTVLHYPCSAVLCLEVSFLGLIQQWDNIIDKENRGTRKEGFVALGWYVGFALLAAVVVSAVKSAISGISLSI